MTGSISPVHRHHSVIPWLLPLVAALVVRLAVWWTLPYRGQISDEAEYLAAATWLAQGRGFSFFKDWIWTRPPLYVVFEAVHVLFSGPHNLAPLRLSQTLLSVATVGLAMLLAARLAPVEHSRRVALLAGWLMALSYSFATYAFLLLSETLFIALLLLGMLLLTIWAQGVGERSGLRRAALLAGGGIALGLAVLTRAMLAGALPLFALWVWRQSGWKLPAKRSVFDLAAAIKGLRAPALLTVVVAAVVLPWSLYNSRFFGGGLILVDTTGGYNALLGVQAGRDESKVYQALKAIPDHAARQAFAYRETLTWVTAHPGDFALKTGRELLDLLMISYGGAERLRSGHTQGDVPIPHLLGLLADDTLYMLAAPLAVVGLFRTQSRPGKGLALAWLGYNLVTGPLFFAINRFRLPLLPLLFIYAACAVAQHGRPWQNTRRPRLAYTAAALLALILLPSFAYWPPVLDPGRLSVLQHTYLGIQSRLRARDCREAERALRSGELAMARRAVERGIGRPVTRNGVPVPLPCFLLLEAQIDLRTDNPEAALEVLEAVERRPERFLLEGEAYRRLGKLDQARGAWVARELEQANPTGWAWDHLQPAPTARIDLGSGFDWGYVDGFYGGEGRAEDPGSYRWAGPRARLRFPAAGTAAPQTLRLHVGGWHPAGEPPARLAVALPGARPLTPALRLDAGWQTVEIPLPPVPPGQDIVLELSTTAFVPGPADLEFHNQLRFLGVQLDWAELSPRPPALVDRTELPSVARAGSWEAWRTAE